MSSFLRDYVYAQEGRKGRPTTGTFYGLRATRAFSGDNLTVLKSAISARPQGSCSVGRWIQRRLSQRVIVLLNHTTTADSWEHVLSV